MFQPGDQIVYGSMGVCRVQDVRVPDFCAPDETRLYYRLKPLNATGEIFVPVDANVFMRPVITKAEAEALIDGIPAIRAEAFHSRVTQELSQHYTEAMQSHDCQDLIELTMSIYAKKRSREEQNQKFGAVDESYMRRAEELLFGELSVALDIPQADVSGYIDARLKANGKAAGASAGCDPL